MVRPHQCGSLGYAKNKFVTKIVRFAPIDLTNVSTIVVEQFANRQWRV